jgi:hypothetical protein
MGNIVIISSMNSIDLGELSGNAVILNDQEKTVAENIARIALITTISILRLCSHSPRSFAFG